MDGTPLAALASGTNCNAKAVVTRSPVLENGVWKRVWLRAKGGSGAWETFLDRTYGSPELPMQPGVTIQFRFASTHFNDGSEIKIKFEAWDAASGDNGNPTASVARTTNAYNKGLILATQVDSDGNYIDPGSPLYSISVAGVAEGIVDDARTKLGPLGTTNMKHDVVSSTSLARQLTEATVKSNLEGMTVFVAGTHGGVTGFNDSFTSLSTSSPGFLSWAEAATSVLARATGTPKPNFVAMYSCETMSSPDDPTAKSAFQLSGFGRAYVGFDAKVLSVLLKGNDANGVPVTSLIDYLHDHSRQLMSGLLDGLKLSDALNLANQIAPPRQMASGSNTNVLLMKLAGDPRMRLKNVHLSNAEETALIAGGGTVTWYYIS